MNLFIPQNYITKAEAFHLMNVSDCMISDQNSSPIIEIGQDFAIAAYKITADNVLVPKALWNDMMVSADIPMPDIQSLINRCNVIGVNPYSGKSTFSVLLPSDFQYKKIQSEKRIFEVINGIIVSGRADKGTLSSSSDSLFAVLHNTKGKVIATQFLSRLTRLLPRWLSEVQMSFGPADCKIEVQKQERIKEELRIRMASIKRTDDPILKEKVEAETISKLNAIRDKASAIVLERKEEKVISIPDNIISLLAHYNLTEIERLSGIDITSHSDGKIALPLDTKQIVMNYIEMNISGTRLVPNEDNTRTVEQRYNIDPIGLIYIFVQTNDMQAAYHYFAQEENSMVAMLNAQSRGTKLNIAQMSGVIGQQTLGGGRIPFTITNESRVLPMFSIRDFDPSSQGFCSSNYFKGMSPTEFYMHSISTRESLTDARVNTGNMGYIERKIAKLLEGIKTEVDGSVRDFGGRIVQFQYGKGGLAPANLTKISGVSTFSNVQQRYTTMIRRRLTTNAYVFIVRTNGEAIGAAVCAHSLRRTNNDSDIICFASPNIQERAFLLLETTCTRVIHYNPSSYFFVLTLTEYTKILYCKPQFAFLGNVEALFDMGTPAGTFSSPDYQPFGDLSNPFSAYQVNASIIPPNVIQNVSSSYSPFSYDMILLTPSLDMYQSSQKLSGQTEVEGRMLPTIPSITSLYAAKGIAWTQISLQYQYIPGTSLTNAGFQLRQVRAYNYRDMKPWSKDRKSNPQLEGWFRWVDDLKIEYPSLTVAITEIVGGYQ